MKVKSLTRVRLLATPWTAAHQAPPSMGFSRQEAEEKGMTENEMVGWYHQFSGHELGQTSGDGEGQRGLACRSPWGHKGSDTTE